MAIHPSTHSRLIGLFTDNCRLFQLFIAETGKVKVCSYWVEYISVRRVWTQCNWCLFSADQWSPVDTVLSEPSLSRRIFSNCSKREGLENFCTPQTVRDAETSSLVLFRLVSAMCVCHVCSGEWRWICTSQPDRLLCREQSPGWCHLRRGSSVHLRPRRLFGRPLATVDHWARVTHPGPDGPQWPRCQAQGLPRPQSSGEGGACSGRAELLPCSDGCTTRLRLSGRPHSPLAASLCRDGVQGHARWTGWTPHRRTFATFLLPTLRPAGGGSATERDPLEGQTVLLGIQSGRSGTSSETTRPRTDHEAGSRLFSETWRMIHQSLYKINSNSDFLTV